MLNKDSSTKSFWHRTFILSLLAFFFAFSSAFAQERTLTGKVTDKDGAGVAGATVRVKGTSKGTTTDGDGAYKLEGVSTGNVVVFEFIGMKSTEVIIAEQAQLDATMQDESELDAVVITGFGETTKLDNTGAISQVKGDAIKGIPTPSFDAALQGRVAGAQIVQSSGVPGSAVRVRIRGQASISGNSEPLYIVDGVPITTGDFSKRDGAANSINGNALADLNPNDIESMEILKDAGAAAIYGSRAANGVVLITTKRGKSGKTAFDASYYYGTTQVTRKLPFVNGTEYLQLIDEAYRNSAGAGLPIPANYAINRGVTVGDALANRTNTNWFDQVLQQGNTQEASISARGGNEKLRFFTGGSYRKDESFFKGNVYERISGRLNLDNAATDRLDIGTQISVTGTINKQVPNVWGTVNSSALPIYPVFNNDGSYFGNNLSQGFNTGANPVAQMQNNFTTKGFRVLANVYANYKIMDGLSFRTEFGTDFYNQYDEILVNSANRNFIPRDFANPAAPVNLPRVFAGSFEERRLNVFNWNLNSFFTYNKKIGDEHQIDATLGFQAQRSAQRTTGAYTYGNAGFSDPYFNNTVSGLQIYDKNLPVSYPTMGGYNADLDNRFAFMSGFARVNYKYAGKYLVSATLRADGSSRFGANKRIGYFPAVSAGWIVSEENFLKDVKVIDYLKLRGSWGITGNAEIPNFMYASTFTQSGGFLGVNGLGPARIANPNLSWERNRNIDIGLEFGLFKGRITGTFAYFNKRTSNLLFANPIQSSTSFTAVFANTDIVIVNRGFELSLNSKNLSASSPVQWTTDFNIATTGNKVKSTGNLPIEAFAAGLGESRLIEGYPVGQGYMMVSGGVDPADGRERFVNPADGSLNKISVENTDWRQPVGKPFPDFFGGINNTISYKGFELNFLMTFQYGNTVFDNEAKFQIGDIANNAQRRTVLNRWQSPQNPGDGSTPGLFLSGPGSGRGLNSDRFMYDASFLRMRTLGLAYNLPKEFVERAKMSNVRLYITAQNLFVLTRYPGWDPEFVNTANVGNTGTFFAPFGSSGAVSQFQQANITFNAAQNPIPQQRTIIVGINVSF